MNEIDEQVRDFIIPYYKETHRFYHNLDHINDMLEVAYTHNIMLSQEQIFAIAFHDIIYLPWMTNGFNETQSAQMVHQFNRMHGNSISPSSMELIQQIIIDTIDHHATIEESKPVLDLDLHGFAIEPNLFNNNTENIRKEYCYVSDEKFRVGRIAFLKGLQTRKYLFSTPYFRYVCEKYAQDNISRELKRLSA